MKNIVHERKAVNPEALDAELRAALGAALIGISAGPNGVLVHLQDDVTAQQVTTAQQLVAAHDPSRLSPRQQAEQERQQQLAALRSAKGAALNPTDYGSKDTLVQVLAQKLAWLEQEVLDLRGGQV